MRLNLFAAAWLLTNGRLWSGNSPKLVAEGARHLKVKSRTLSRNPIELVVVKGATKRTRQPRSLTVEEFRKLIAELAEPFKTMARLSVSFGLSVSELLALR